MLYCCECKTKVRAKLVDGTVIYPHRHDLASVPFWQCPVCNNYVGCHHKSKDPTKPLGPIPNNEIRRMRRKIHSTIDPLWREGYVTRSSVYHTLSLAAGYSFHVGELIDETEGAKILEHIEIIYAQELTKVRQAIVF